MDTKNTVHEILMSYDPEIRKLYAEFLNIEKETLNNRNENDVVNRMLTKVRGL